MSLLTPNSKKKLEPEEIAALKDTMKQVFLEHNHMGKMHVYERMYCDSKKNSPYFQFYGKRGENAVQHLIKKYRSAVIEELNKPTEENQEENETAIENTPEKPEETAKPTRKSNRKIKKKKFEENSDSSQDSEEKSVDNNDSEEESSEKTLLKRKQSKSPPKSKPKKKFKKIEIDMTQDNSNDDSDLDLGHINNFLNDDFDFEEKKKPFKDNILKKKPVTIRNIRTTQTKEPIELSFEKSPDFVLQTDNFYYFGVYTIPGDYILEVTSSSVKIIFEQSEKLAKAISKDISSSVSYPFTSTNCKIIYNINLPFEIEQKLPILRQKDVEKVVSKYLVGAKLMTEPEPKKTNEIIVL